MSTFENDHYRWRETYFVLFKAEKRPSSKKVAAALKKSCPRFELVNLVGDDAEQFESLTVRSHEDFSALDISCTVGEEVTEQVGELKSQMEEFVSDAEEQTKLDRLEQFDAKFDILHFEELSDDSDGEDDGMLDPSALLSVLDALVHLTDGVGIDPQSGTIV